MKLTLISIKIKGIRYSRFVRITRGAILTEDEIFKLLGVVVPAGTTYTVGG